MCHKLGHFVSCMASFLYSDIHSNISKPQGELAVSGDRRLPRLELDVSLPCSSLVLTLTMLFRPILLLASALAASALNLSGKVSTTTADGSAKSYKCVRAAFCFHGVADSQVGPSSPCHARPIHLEAVFHHRLYPLQPGPPALRGPVRRCQPAGNHQAWPGNLHHRTLSLTSMCFRSGH